MTARVAVNVAPVGGSTVSRRVIALRNEDIDHSPFQMEAPIPIQIHRLPLHLAFCCAQVIECPQVVSQRALGQAAEYQRDSALHGQG